MLKVDFPSIVFHKNGIKKRSQKITHEMVEQIIPRGEEESLFI